MMRGSRSVADPAFSSQNLIRLPIQTGLLPIFGLHVPAVADSRPQPVRVVHWSSAGAIQPALVYFVCVHELPTGGLARPVTHYSPAHDLLSSIPNGSRADYSAFTSIFCLNGVCFLVEVPTIISILPPFPPLPDHGFGFTSPVT